ncbi:MAG: 7-cyano-7-deazaguanine synthase QueC [Acidimicrobiia bacterium]|nr:7-cyano-7-deazaguanine synthase QueC [Acidimicrobiia bacterium]
MSDRAIVLLSGGLDSATCLAIARQRGFDPVALSVRYGQRNDAELRAAAHLAAQADAPHVVTTVDLGLFGGSALTGDGEVPKHDADHPVGSGPIPATYVPARNTVLLSLALALAEVHDAADIFIGVNATDYSGYPDCRPEFVAAFETVANVATKAATEGGRRCRIHAPLIELSKAEIIDLGRTLGVDHAATMSCYDPDPSGAACGRCDACILRRRGFDEAGVTDPTRYAAVEP